MFAQPSPDAPLLELPLFLSPVACGFPSPAQDYTEQTINLNQLVPFKCLVKLHFTTDVDS